MRTPFAALIACACTTMANAGELIVEPDQFTQSRSILHTYGLSVQHQTIDIGEPQFSRRTTEWGRIINNPGPIPSSHGWNRTEYLWTGNFPHEPFTETDRIFVGARALTRSGDSMSGLARLASIQTTTSTQFYLTETATVNLSGFFDLSLSDFGSGGSRFAHASINIARIGDGLADWIFRLNRYNENIPSSVDWSATLEPGLYSFGVGLQSLASASTPGDSAMSDISTNLELTFAAIPAPASTGLIGVIGLFAARRRRR